VVGSVCSGAYGNDHVCCGSCPVRCACLACAGCTSAFVAGEVAFGDRSGRLGARRPLRDSCRYGHRSVRRRGLGASAIVLFAVSAIYHDRVWGPKVHAVLSRMDHANIFVFIAGSYTPFGLIALHGTEQKIGCGIVWTSCAVSAIMRILWSSTPRWLIVGLCMGIGAAAGAAGDQMLNAAGPAVVALLVAGGLLYSIGGIVYGLKRPNPWPAHFGFHEIFHACTLGAFALHAIAVGLLIL
jgi:hemolysin III